MGPARIAVLAIAAVAAIAAALLKRGMMSGGGEVVTAAPAEEPEETLFVLVANRDLEVGDRLTPEDMAWLEWPAGSVGASYVVRFDAPEAMDEFSGQVVRIPMFEEEPIIPGKLLDADDAGYLSAVLAPGMRAYTVSISVESAAGGFILPGDRVDLLVTGTNMDAQGEGLTAAAAASRGVQQEVTTRTILENVEVLAIDQTFRGEEDERVVVGSTATLEVSPGEAELIARAQAMGDLSLSLRSAADAMDIAEGGDRTGQTRVSAAPVQSTVQVYRYGGASQVAVRSSGERQQ